MRSCYSNSCAFELYKSQLPSDVEDGHALTEERVKELIQKALRAGHESVLEHGLFTFDLQGVSRVCTHQLVRHRIASFSQQSQRHAKVSFDADWYVVPPSFKEDSRKKFEERMKAVASWYLEESGSGGKIEDARFYLPSAARTNVVVSMNPRELLHVFQLRCGAEAQWEIRAVAWAMLACSRLIAPTIFAEIKHSPADASFEERKRILEEILSEVRPHFERTGLHETFEIPLSSLELKSGIQAFVYKT